MILKLLFLPIAAVVFALPEQFKQEAPAPPPYPEVMVRVRQIELRDDQVRQFIVERQLSLELEEVVMEMQQLQCLAEDLREKHGVVRTTVPPAFAPAMIPAVRGHDPNGVPLHAAVPLRIR